MEKDKKYKITIVVLIGIIFMLGISLLTSRQKPKEIAKPKEVKPVVFKGKIAIVIDDWGYNLNNAHILKEFKYPITGAVLPNLAFTKQIAEELNSCGFEVILHLPMQPHEKVRLEKNTIMVNSSKEKILDVLDKDLASIGYAKGVSNHMGSLATEDAKTTEIVMSDLKKRHLYFLDSYVTGKSVCPAMAKKIGLSFAKRDIFLDNIEEAEYIKKQLYKLKIKAMAQGKAIGIGHDRKVTLEVLKASMPEMAKEGFKFVFVSDLKRN
ncbi:MAG: divergent polysaccharide deacetylase family protein [Candidatus Omnitrophica bacterium]|nr:divergent polysaccharide deacetylase family protein [Candidatus Omnitrophota bacterium]